MAEHAHLRRRRNYLCPLPMRYSVSDGRVHMTFDHYEIARREAIEEGSGLASFDALFHRMIPFCETCGHLPCSCDYDRVPLYPDPVAMQMKARACLDCGSLPCQCLRRMLPYPGGRGISIRYADRVAVEYGHAADKEYVRRTTSGECECRQWPCICGCDLGDDALYCGECGDHPCLCNGRVRVFHGDGTYHIEEGR